MGGARQRPSHTPAKGSDAYASSSITPHIRIYVRGFSNLMTSHDPACKNINNQREQD